MPFFSLGLSTPLLRAVAEENYAAPTPVQSAAISAVLGWI
jgi:superfamily II DNA/RNA helicase